MSETIYKKLTKEELYAFSDEMGMMISSGVSAVEAVTLMLEESKGEDEKALLTKMQDIIYETGSLSRAVSDVGVFPTYFVDMIRMGEQTGNTDDVLVSLAGHYSREISISQAIRSAISYPMLMVGMMLIIIIVLVTQIMPIFERVFISLGSNMDGISGGLLSIGKFMNTYAIVFWIILAALVACGFYLGCTKKGRKHLVSSTYRMKIFKSIYDKIAVARFASGMAMTLGSGMDVMQSLEVAGNLVRTPGFEDKIEKCKDSFTETMDLGKSFSSSGIFSGLYGRMAVLAAKTGNMESVMEKVAQTYQEEADDEINDLISVVEPTLVIVMSVIVGLILLSVMLPLLSIMTGMV